ncbi:MFS transporter [Streptomyces sp. JJ38]|uniref:MFS transporter n=1 Tax=Streptomyces sp. JJ38 TaxID=2738128 RepID=UPI001C58AE11|nr:MFS transporter [Streptomyces sp. JJ38]MBW1597899.1 MFS transporter [Streptomyces sp. JJ38]
MSVYLHRNFLLSFLASFISLFGSKLLMISYVAYVFTEKGSATLAAIVFAADWIANLFIGILGAQYIDRQDARKLLIWLNLVTAGVTLVFLGFTDPDLYVYAVVIIFLRALLKSAVQNARVKGLVQFFSEKETNTFSPLFNSALPIAMALAGAVGIVILDIAGMAAVVLIDAACFLVAAGLMVLVRPNKTRLEASLKSSRGEGRRTSLAGVREASSLMSRNDTIGTAVFYIVLSVTAFQATYESLITVIPEIWYGYGESGIALFFTFESISIMAGAFIYQWFSRRDLINDANKQKVNLSVVTAITALYLAMPATSDNIVLAVAVFSLMVLGGEIIWVHHFKLMIATTPDARVSSVVGLQTAIGYSLMAVFAFVFARGLDSSLGIDTTVYLNVALTVGLVIGWELLRRRIQRREQQATPSGVDDPAPAQTAAQ